MPSLVGHKPWNVGDGSEDFGLDSLDFCLYLIRLPLPIFDKRSTRLVLGGLSIGLFWFLGTVGIFFQLVSAFFLYFKLISVCFLSKWVFQVSLVSKCTRGN